MKETIIVSQLGARMHYAVPRIFHNDDRLAHFYTDISAVKGWPRLLNHVPPRFLPGALRRLSGRVPRGVPVDSMTGFTMLGLRSALERLRGRTQADEIANALWAGRALSQRAIRCGFHGAGGVYGFSGECLDLLVAANAQGLWTVVEQMIAPRGIVDGLAAEEEIRFPDWQLPSGRNPFAADFAKREKAEWSVADLIVCPSGFVRDGVIASGGDPHRCAVVPYGFDGWFRPASRARTDGPLRVLTVGEVGLRKGSPYVVEAARRLRGHASFRMVGPCRVSGVAKARIEDAVDLKGTVPRSEMAAAFAWADIFLLPSLCEGSATSVYEALAAGLPVITTPNTGTVVRDGVDGFIVPLRDSQAIVTCIRKLADPQLRIEMATNAAARSADFTVAQYGSRLLAAIDAMLVRQYRDAVPWRDGKDGQCAA